MRVKYYMLLRMLENIQGSYIVRIALEGAQLSRDTMLEITSTKYFDHGNLVIEVNAVTA